MTECQRCQNDTEDIGSDLWRADRVGYDPETETYHAQHDWESDPSITRTVIETIAVATGFSPTTMEPLYSVINPDALETLLSSADETNLQVQFTYDRWPVTVFSSGEMIVHDPT